MDTTALKKLAEAAPSGPWLSENDSIYFGDDGYTRHMLDIGMGYDLSEDSYYAALAFITAANPEVILLLLAEIDKLRGLEPVAPPRPPEGEGLPRYGIRWNGPQQPIAVPLADGYWTPWHLASRATEDSSDAQA